VEANDPREPVARPPIGTGQCRPPKIRQASPSKQCEIQAKKNQIPQPPPSAAKISRHTPANHSAPSGTRSARAAGPMKGPRQPSSPCRARSAWPRKPPQVLPSHRSAPTAKRTPHQGRASLPAQTRSVRAGGAWGVTGGGVHGAGRGNRRAGSGQQGPTGYGGHGGQPHRQSPRGARPRVHLRVPVGVFRLGVRVGQPHCVRPLLVLLCYPPPFPRG